MTLPLPRARTFLIVIIGLVLAAFSAVHALTMSTRMLQPDVALKLDADEPVALIRVAARQVSAAEQAKRAPPPSVVRDARQSLERLAINPSALLMLAIAGKPADSSIADPRLIALSDRISRRDLATQIMRIREAAARQDLTLARDAYDKALTVNEGSWQLMFPPLSELMKSPQGREQIAHFIDRGAPWLSPFFRSSLDANNAPKPYFDLLIARGGLTKLSGARQIQDVLVNSLVAHGNWDMARKAFLFGKYGPPGALTSASLSKTTIGDGKNTLYWFFPSNAGLAATPVNARYLSVSAEPGYSGTVAQKVVYLRPGRYDLAIVLAEPDGGEALDLKWTVQCLPDAAKAKTELLVERSVAGSRISAAFTVPPSCNAVMLLLSATTRPSERLAGEAVIEDISLRPAR